MAAGVGVFEDDNVGTLLSCSSISSWSSSLLSGFWILLLPSFSDAHRSNCVLEPSEIQNHKRYKFLKSKSQCHIIYSK